jgi:hypothetical protein
MLEWETASSTTNLLVLRTRQIVYCKCDIDTTQNNMLKVQQHVADNYNCRHAYLMMDGVFAQGPWVLVHKTWLDNQHSYKTAPRWTRPYIIIKQSESRSYWLAELDWTAIKVLFAADHLKLYYHMNYNQSMTLKKLVSAHTTCNNHHSRPYHDFTWGFSPVESERKYQNVAELASADTQLVVLYSPYSYLQVVITNALELMNLDVLVDF